MNGGRGKGSKRHSNTSIKASMNMNDRELLMTKRCKVRLNRRHNKGMHLRLLNKGQVYL
jgi:hypothetical protein